jgi:hypothetical protein
MAAGCEAEVFVVSEGVFVAARRVRAFLPHLVPASAGDVEVQLAELLNEHQDPETEAQLRAVFAEDAALQMFLDAVLDDAPRFRPPQVVRQTKREAGFSPLPGLQVPPDPDQYCCPEGDFEWYSPGVGTRVPPCPTPTHISPLRPC